MIGGDEISTYLVSSKDIDCNVMSQNFVYDVMFMWQEEPNSERESDEERILKSMVAPREEKCFYSFSYLILFWCTRIFARYDEN